MVSREESQTFNGCIASRNVWSGFSPEESPTTFLDDQLLSSVSRRKSCYLSPSLEKDTVEKECDEDDSPLHSESFPTTSSDGEPGETCQHDFTSGDPAEIYLKKEALLKNRWQAMLQCPGYDYYDEDLNAEEPTISSTELWGDMDKTAQQLALGGILKASEDFSESTTRAPKHVHVDAESMQSCNASVGNKPRSTHCKEALKSPEIIKPIMCGLRIKVGKLVVHYEYPQDNETNMKNFYYSSSMKLVILTSAERVVEEIFGSTNWVLARRSKESAGNLTDTCVFSEEIFLPRSYITNYSTDDVYSGNSKSHKEAVLMIFRQECDETGLAEIGEVHIKLNSKKHYRGFQRREIHNKLPLKASVEISISYTEKVTPNKHSLRFTLAHDEVHPALEEARNQAKLEVSKEVLEKTSNHSVSAEKKLDTPLQLQWAYLDDYGVLQGPYGSNTILQWVAQGYFDKDSKFKLACDAGEGYFSKLAKMLDIMRADAHLAGPRRLNYEICRNAAPETEYNKPIQPPKESYASMEAKKTPHGKGGCTTYFPPLDILMHTAESQQDDAPILAESQGTPNDRKTIHQYKEFEKVIKLVHKARACLSKLQSRKASHSEKIGKKVYNLHFPGEQHTWIAASNFSVLSRTYEEDIFLEACATLIQAVFRGWRTRKYINAFRQRPALMPSLHSSSFGV